MGEIDNLKKQLKGISKRMRLLEEGLEKNQKRLIKEAFKEFAKKKGPLKSEFDRKFVKSKRQIIKQKILETIQIKPMPLADLKHYIVDQLNYCSKATFYRYINEMKGHMEIKNNIAYLTEKAVA